MFIVKDYTTLKQLDYPLTQLDTWWLSDHKMDDSFLWFYYLEDKNFNAKLGNKKVNIIGAIEFSNSVGNTCKEMLLTPSLTINNIQVESSFNSESQKRKGFGTLIIKNFEKYAISQNVKSISFAVEEDNLSAIKFYEKVGYTNLYNVNNEKCMFNNGEKNCFIYFKNL